MFCHSCGGVLIFLGQLGNLFWFRCRQCGLEQSHEESEVEEAQELSVN
jgi:DNA-directed RNA polymerase subunit M/transcription elongation factor TFIIS